MAELAVLVKLVAILVQSFASWSSPTRRVVVFVDSSSAIRTLTSKSVLQWRWSLQDSWRAGVSVLRKLGLELEFEWVSFPRQTLDVEYKAE